MTPAQFRKIHLLTNLVNEFYGSERPGLSQSAPIAFSVLHCAGLSEVLLHADNLEADREWFQPAHSCTVIINANGNIEEFIDVFGNIVESLIVK